MHPGPPNRKEQRFFYILVTALFLGLTGRSLLTHGMFTDGTTYAVISRNLALGMGSLWDLHYTTTLYPHFHEHPPLAFWLQGLFFRIFGDHYFVERLYSAGSFFLTALITVLTWKRISPGGYRTFGWLPVLFWLTAPLATWAATNNLLENTVMIFTGLSVLLVLKRFPGLNVEPETRDTDTREPGAREPGAWEPGAWEPGAWEPDTRETGAPRGPAPFPRHRPLLLLFAGALLGCGFLTKGFVALFPLSLPFWLFLFHREGTFRGWIRDTFILLVGIGILLVPVLLLMPGSRESLEAYLTGQVIGSITGVRTVGSRFHIVGRLILAVVPGVLLLLLIGLTGKQRRVRLRFDRRFFVFLALGLSAVLPIMVSMKQRDFYILPALPFLALAMAVPAAPHVKRLAEKLVSHSRLFRIMRGVVLLLLTAAIGLHVLQAGKTGREEALLEDVRILVDEIPGGTVVCIPRELFDNWALHAYLHRYAMISLDPSKDCTSSWYLAYKESTEVPEGSFVEMERDLNRYRLFFRITN